jgi:hypothetical protein
MFSILSRFQEKLVFKMLLCVAFFVSRLIAVADGDVVGLAVLVGGHRLKQVMTVYWNRSPLIRSHMLSDSFFCLW